MLTKEQSDRCTLVTMSVCAICTTLAETLHSEKEVRTTLEVALFLTQKYMEGAGVLGERYEDEVRQMIISGLGFVN